MADDTRPQAKLPPDTLTQRIGVLARREVEARILAPVIDALGEKFGREAVIEVVKQAVVEIAHTQGRELAVSMNGSGSDEFADSMQFWSKDDALQFDVIKHDNETLDFNVTRCRYAEMYGALGIPELGAVFSCNRDYAMVGGFNPEAKLTRTQTIMEGASHCDFRFQFPGRDSDPS
jgi:hypothetical protein